MDQEMKNANIDNVEFIDTMIKLLLGEKAAKEIDAMELSITDYQAIMIAIMAAVTGEDYEVAEARFRKETGI
jgi:hypothetical protein